VAEMNPDYVIDSVADLIPVVSEINKKLSQGIGPNSLSSF
jgi:hypothetical protein